MQRVKEAIVIGDPWDVLLSPSQTHDGFLYSLLSTCLFQEDIKVYIQDGKNVDLDVKHQHKQASKEPDRKFFSLRQRNN